MTHVSWIENSLPEGQDGRPQRLIIRRTRNFDQFLGRWGIDINQVVNSEGGLQELLVACRRVEHQVEEWRRLRRWRERRDPATDQSLSQPGTS
jgi:hypothetical protein